MSRQIIVKATPDFVQQAAETVRQRVAVLLAGRVSAGVEVTRVFPNQDRGNRARLFAVHLPDDLSDQELSGVVDDLRGQTQLEYAEIPSPKAPSAFS